MQIFGIDISKWQGNFDFERAKNEGVGFAIIKGGGGDDGLYVDGKFKNNYENAKKLSLPVGCYWYSRASSVEEAKNEAEYFYQNVIKGRKFELPLYIDVEDKALISAGKRTVTDIIKAWCAYLEEKGCFVGIYSSLYYFANYMYDSELQNLSHWVACWAESCPYPASDIFGMWQFGGETNLIRTNTVSGVVCDQNYMFFDFPAMIKERGLNGFEKEETKSDPEPEESTPVFKPVKTVEELASEVILGLWGVGADRKNRLEAAGYSYNDVQNEVNRRYEVKPEIPTPAVFKNGDKVKLATEAPIWGQNGKFASFVYAQPMYILSINGDRVVFSKDKGGAVTGAVDKKYLTLIK